MKITFDPLVTAAVVIPFISHVISFGTSAVVFPSAVAMSFLTVLIGYLNARVDSYLASLGLKGAWAFIAYVTLRAIFGRALRAVAAGTSAFGSTLRQIGSMRK